MTKHLFVQPERQQEANTDREAVPMDKASGGSGATPAPPREARLRAEYAEEYPGIEAGTWITAAELANLLVERTHARRLQNLYTRTFDPRHFEFRGGAPPRPTNKRNVRTRATDR
jgi:hypothetical protein